MTNNPLFITCFRWCICTLCYYRHKKYKPLDIVYGYVMDSRWLYISQISYVGKSHSDGRAPNMRRILKFRVNDSDMFGCSYGLIPSQETILIDAVVQIISFNCVPHACIDWSIEFIKKAIYDNPKYSYTYYCQIHLYWPVQLALFLWYWWLITHPHNYSFMSSTSSDNSSELLSNTWNIIINNYHDDDDDDDDNDDN